jgi:release factor glutamine methyltransferase
MPLDGLLRAAADRLAAAGVASPRVDAELLMAHVLGVPRGRLRSTGAPSADQRAEFARLLARRVAREPLQHILGVAWFRRLKLAVGPGVFVPRPETELLVDAVLPVLREGSVVVDLCAGSGAIALAVADEAAGIRVIAVERDPAALKWLTRNAVGSDVEVLRGDVRDIGLLAGLRGAVDVVVSNPPYVPTSVAVAEEVRRDPAGAVFAGQDGLAVIRHVLSRAAELLRPGGLLAIEHDDTHGVAVPELLAAAGAWHEITDHPDLAGRPRFTTAVRAR